MVVEDNQAWLKYPKHRWIYNKLELSLSLGYDAGPACVPITKSGNYIVRPIYNLYGMGIGAKLIHLSKDDIEDMANHAHIPPGYFWCEAFEGIHYSIDYQRTGAPLSSIFYWEPICTMIGETDKNQLTKFKSWVKIENINIDLPHFLNQLDGVDLLNIELIGNKIIEVHLRSGNDVMYDRPIGTKLIPIWADDPGTINISNEDPYTKYDAFGYLDHVRLGYRIED